MLSDAIQRTRTENAMLLLWMTLHSIHRMYCVHFYITIIKYLESPHSVFSIFSTRGVVVTGDNDGNAAIWDVLNKKRLAEVYSSTNCLLHLGFPSIFYLDSKGESLFKPLNMPEIYCCLLQILSLHTQLMHTSYFKLSGLGLPLSTLIRFPSYMP